MHSILRCASITAVAALAFAVGASRAEDAKSREFSFRYDATVTGLKPGQTARIWLPVPPSNGDQTVTYDKADLPSGAKIEKESKYGNQVLYVESKANDEGKITVGVTYTVKRSEVRGEAKGTTSDMAELFLGADAKVPVGGKC